MYFSYVSLSILSLHGHRLINVFQNTCLHYMSFCWNWNIQFDIKLLKSASHFSFLVNKSYFFRKRIILTDLSWWNIVTINEKSVSNHRQYCNMVICHMMSCIKCLEKRTSISYAIYWLKLIKGEIAICHIFNVFLIYNKSC